MKKLLGMFALCMILSFSIALSAQADSFKLIYQTVEEMLDANGAQYVTLLSSGDTYDHGGNFNLSTYLGDGPVDISVLGGSAGNALYLSVNGSIVYSKNSTASAEWYPDGQNAKMVLENVILSDITLGLASAVNLNDGTAYEADPQGTGSKYTNKLQAFLLLDDFMFRDTLFKAGTLIIGGEDSVDGDFNDIVIAIAPTAQTPIPAAALLLGSGLAGLGMIRRKMK